MSILYSSLDGVVIVIHGPQTCILLSVSDIFSQTSQVTFITAVIITFHVVLESSTLKYHSKQKKITAIFHIYLKNVFVLS